MSFASWTKKKQEDGTLPKKSSGTVAQETASPSPSKVSFSEWTKQKTGIGGTNDAYDYIEKWTFTPPEPEKFKRETNRWTSDGGGRKSTARRMEDIQADLDAANNRRKRLQMEESILLAPDAMTPNDDRLGEVRTALEALAKEITAMDTEKRVEELYSTTGHRDSFSGQFDANMELGRLSQDQGRAWSAYLDDPSDINRKQAELQDEAIRAFLLRNGAALDDEGVVGSWISKDLASNLPQRMDQLKAGAGGAAVGGIAGSLLGPAGIKKGIKWGSSLAVGQDMYDVARGAAYKRFIDMGVDDELARALAQDEGIAMGLSESASTGLGWVLTGGSKALQLLLPGLAGKATTALGKSALAQLWNKIPGAVKAVGGYALNVGQEGGEEGWQEGISIANDKRALAGEDSGLLELFKASIGETFAEENRDRVLDATEAGMRLAALMGGAQTLGNQALAYGLGRGVSPTEIEAIPSPESKSDENNLPVGQNLPAELAQAARETTSEGNSMGQAENAAEGLKMASEGIGAEQALPSPAVRDVLMKILTDGERVDQTTLTPEQFDTLADRDDVGMDATGRVYKMEPTQHISQRTYESVGSRSVNAFQFDHPELQSHYKAAAQQLIDDAALSLDAPKTTHKERGAQGKRFVTEILDSPSLRYAMDLGLTRNDIIQAAQDLIADHGQENHAAAKRLEFVLDDMLTNGYTTVRGESVAPNSAYIAAKQSIVGYQEQARDALPIWDMPEAQDRGRSAGQDLPSPAAVQPDNDLAQQAAEAKKRVVSSALDVARKSMGDEGYKAFQTAYREADDVVASVQELRRAYNDGLANAKTGSRVLTEGQYDVMYEAGRADAAASIEKQAKQAGYATVHGKDSGLVYDEYVKTELDSKTAKVINAVAKALGVKVQFVDQVGGGDANAQIQAGVIQIAKADRTRAVRFLMGHEITHRMQEMAPTEYARLREAVAAAMATDGGLSVKIQGEQERYARKNRSISSEAAMDEAVADYVGSLLEDSGELERFIRKHYDDRTLLEKLRDAIRDLIRKLRDSKDSQNTKQLLRVEKRLSETLDAAVKQVQANERNDVGVDVSAKLSLKDSEYMDAVFNDDMETAQRMVDEAAMEWADGDELFEVDEETGELLFKYYRSSDWGRTVWDSSGNNPNQGVFLTSDVHVAREFANTRGKGEHGKIITVFAKAKNPLVLDAHGEIYAGIPVDDTAPEWVQDMADVDVSWSDAENDFVEEWSVDIDRLYPKAFKNGYDAVIVKNVVEGVGGPPATDVVLKDGGKQMKSADPVTYDDNGNVIPLSERFNPDNKDIRYSLKDSDYSDDARTYAEIEEERYKLNQRERELRDRKREVENNPDLLQALDDYSGLFSELRGLLSKKRAGTAIQAELERIEEIKVLRDERMDHIKDLQESLGLNDIAKEEEELRKTKEELRVASDAAWAREGAEKENKAIEKSGLSAPEYFRKKALKAFKTTTNFNEAGYLLPDGKMLNFSGGERNHRYRDHREIGEIYEATQGTAALNRFLSDGNIRIMAESPGIDLASGVEPTNEQYAALRRFIRANGVQDGQFFVDFSDIDGHRMGNYSYTDRVSSDKILDDIKYFYENGKVREQSDVAKFHSARYSLKDSDFDTAVNQSMTMAQAKDMVQRAFVLGGIKEWFEGEYRNGDEWLKGEGADAVALVIDNEWPLQEKYLNKIQGLMDGEFTTEDILEAYAAGTLTGKPVQDTKPKRLNVSGEVAALDERFYAPRQIEDAKAAYELASQKVTNKNRDAVYKARADVIMFAHTRGAAEALGLTQSELNKKLSTWARYTARARETSQRFNAGVADWNKWTGIENSNILTRSTVRNEDLDRLVGEITGDSDGFQRKYIMRTMLALDTHIDYTGLKFEFVGRPSSTSSSVNGLYSDSERKIRVKYNAPHTVAHEMGHYLDYQWARDVGVSGSLTDGFNRNRLTDPDVKQWVENFDKFKDSLTDAADLHSSYTMDAKEVFARFVDKFVRWVNFTANGEQDRYTIDRSDKFTAQHYIEFVRLLQEKSVLDGKKRSAARLSLKDSDSLAREIARIQKEGRAKKRSDADIQADISAVVQQAYQGMISEYGVIAPGENPAREVKIPKQTSDDKKVSQTVRTILEAGATPDELVPKLEELVADGEFSYDAYTDEKAIADATEKIGGPNGKGWPAAQRDWFATMRKGEVSKENTTMGWVLYNHAANSGDTALALDILNEMVKSQRNAAQALQATRILKKLSPETRLYGAQRSVNSLQEELNKRYGDKKAPRLVISQELAERYMKAQTQEERDEVMKDIYRDVGRQMPPRFIDKWNAWRYLAMLGNVRTHVRNVVGNAGFALPVAAKNLQATVIEAAVRRVSGGKLNRSKSAMSGTALYNVLNKDKPIIFGNKKDRALLKAAWDDFAKVEDQVMGNGKYSESVDANQYIEEGRQIFKFKPLEMARKGNSAAMEAEDKWFSRPHYAAALASYCKQHGLTPEQIQRGKETKTARLYAMKEAQKATYRDTNDFSQLISKIRFKNPQNGLEKAANAVMEGILPFRKTPANILVRGLEYSPLGLMNGIKQAVWDVKRGKKTGAEAIDSISAGLTGTELLGLGLYLAAQGLIRGHGGDDDEQKEFEEMMGHQAYALEIGDQSYTLDWLAPEALPFFVGVNLWEQMEADQELTFRDALSAIGTVTEPLLEMSCLQSLNAVFETVGYASSNEMSGLTTALSSAATSYLTQALPTLLGQAERTSEDVRMTTYTDKNGKLPNDWQYTLGKASSRLPGDYQQIPYIDAWGRTESNGAPGERAANNFLNPAYTSEIQMSAMEEELLRLYEETGEGKVLPSRAKKSFPVNKVEKNLTADEYVKFAQKKGQTAYTVLTSLTQSSAYKAMDDTDKVDAISKVYSYSEAVAKMSVSNYKPDGWVADAVAASKSVGLSADKYLTVYLNAQGIESLKNRETGETISKSESLLVMQMIYNTPGLSSAQRKALIDNLATSKSVRHYNSAKVKEELAKMRKMAK